jgi:hypothetical protein
MINRVVSRQSFRATGGSLGAALIAGSSLANAQPARTVSSLTRAVAGTIQVKFGYSGGTFIEKYFAQDFATAAHDLPGIQIKQVIYPTYDGIYSQRRPGAAG